jgi:hypothetical protein
MKMNVCAPLALRVFNGSRREITTAMLTSMPPNSL